MAVKASISFERCRNELEAFQIGPLGDQKGREWNYISKGAITGIMITCDAYAVVSFDFKGVEEHGNVEYSDTFGFHGKTVSKIMLNWPEEYFTSLSGTYYLGSLKCHYFSSISFHTNRKKYGPFSYVHQHSIPFEFPMNGRVIVGFYGSIVNENWIYGTLGVHVKHSTDLFGPSSTVQVVKLKTKVVRSIFNQEECIKVGPWGWSRSSIEEEWSYMLKGVTKIKIGYNGDCIQWISFKSSDEKGEIKHSQKSNTSNEQHEPEEYLVLISVTLRDTMKDIESLCFYVRDISALCIQPSQPSQPTTMLAFTANIKQSSPALNKARESIKSPSPTGRSSSCVEHDDHLVTF